jgi:hypothetical protein
VNRRLPIFLAAAVALIAVVETANALIAPLRVPAPRDWEAAAAAVRAKKKPDDLIVFAPHWVDELGRAHLGDLISVEMAGHADADRYARVWEVSIRGEHAPETSGARLVEESRFGKVRVALYEKPSVEVVYDFTSHAADARVTQSFAFGNGAEQPCYRDGTGFRCAGTRVEPRTLEMDFLPRRGMLVPVDGGRVTRLEYPDITLGKSLIIHTGIHDYISRKRGDGVVDLRVLVDGVEKLAVKTGNADNWRRYEIDTSSISNGTHSVRFEIRAADAAWRTFGFHAEARK